MEYKEIVTATYFHFKTLQTFNLIQGKHWVDTEFSLC